MLTLSKEALKKLFEDNKSIAIIGAKDQPGQPVDNVGRYLIDQGYVIYPVHPVRENVWGLPTYKNLTDITDPVDIVCVFRAPQFCAAHAAEALQLHPLPKVFWMQLGIDSPEARECLKGANMTIVGNACIMVEHARVFEKTPFHGQTLKG